MGARVFRCASTSEGVDTLGEAIDAVSTAAGATTWGAVT